MILALCFFLSGALVGLYMLIRHLKRRPLPKLAAVLHGLAGATGFGILLATVVQMPTLVFARYALIVFIAAILLGVVNVLFHIRGKRHRTILILVHGLTAVVGAVTLMIGIVIALGSENANATDKTVASASATANAPTPSAKASVAEVASAKPPVSAQPQPTEVPAPTASATTPSTPSVSGMHPGPAWPDQALTFYEDSAVLSPTARASLSAIAKDLQKHTEVTLVEVQGYADERGADAHNLDLTRSRASAVVDALAAAGVARTRLRSAGYGASCPADVSCQTTPAPASCHQPSAWQKDRRVVLLVLESGSEHFHGRVACDRAASLVPAEDQKYTQ
jgi:outer membrane protein OmpA-like peptidoglycan-associated protein